MTQLQYVECKIGDKVYGKYQVVVPRDIVERAGWKAKEEVRFRADDKGRIIATAHTPEQRAKRMAYEDFKNAVFPILLNAPTAGMTWSQVRARNLALPIKPHALWVRRLEGDIGLKRDSGSGCVRKMWKMESKPESGGIAKPKWD